jgi:hypothetical protein
MHPISENKSVDFLRHLNPTDTGIVSANHVLNKPQQTNKQKSKGQRTNLREFFSCRIESSWRSRIGMLLNRVRWSDGPEVFAFGFLSKDGR